MLNTEVWVSNNSGVSYTKDTANTSKCQISVTGNKYYGQTITLSATPAAGYAFAGWYTPSGTLLSINEAYSYKMMATNETYCARFNLQAKDITIASVGNGTSSMYGTLNGKNQGTPQSPLTSGTRSFDYGSKINLTATPLSSDYLFAGWVLNGSTVSWSTNYTPTVTGNATYTAVEIKRIPPFPLISTAVQRQAAEVSTMSQSQLEIPVPYRTTSTKQATPCPAGK